MDLVADVGVEAIGSVLAEVLGVVGDAGLISLLELVLLVAEARSVAALAIAKHRIHLVLGVQTVNEIFRVLLRYGPHLVETWADRAMLVFAKATPPNGGREWARNGQTCRASASTTRSVGRPCRSRGFGMSQVWERCLLQGLRSCHRPLGGSVPLRNTPVERELLGSGHPPGYAGFRTKFALVVISI